MAYVYQPKGGRGTGTWIFLLTVLAVGVVEQILVRFH